TSAPQDDTVHEVVIVGSGPDGYTAAIYTARAEMNPIVVAGALDAGGALMTTTDVENFPGFPEGIQGPELMTQLQEQAERFGAKVVYEDAVELDLEGDIKRVTLEDGTVYRAKSLIITTGSAYRKLGVDGEETLSGKGVSWCATCDGFFFKDQEIVVVGGGDSAVEEATFLTRFGKSVTLVHRRDQLRASKIMARRAEADPKLSFAWNSEIVSINGADKVESVTLRDTVTGEERVLLTDAVFEAIGHIPPTELLRGKLELDDEGYIVCEGRFTHTSVPGVFAAADVADRTYRHAVTAAGTGCQAAPDAERWLGTPLPVRTSTRPWPTPPPSDVRRSPGERSGGGPGRGGAPRGRSRPRTARRGRG